MLPFVATGALNPEPGVTAAVMSVDPTNPPQIFPHIPVPFSAIPLDKGPIHGAESLARQIQEAWARCRALGHREPRITLMRPTAVIEGVQALLEQAGLMAKVVPSRVSGVSILKIG